MRNSMTNYMVVNPRYTTSRVESNAVNICCMTCRICDSMRHVAVFRIESVVLQDSTKKTSEKKKKKKNMQRQMHANEPKQNLDAVAKSKRRLENLRERALPKKFEYQNFY